MANITITKITIDGFDVDPPHGLSELLNAAGAWSKEKPKTNYLKDYDQKTERREDGSLVTVLTKKQR